MVPMIVFYRQTIFLYLQQGYTFGLANFTQNVPWNTDKMEVDQTLPFTTSSYRHFFMLELIKCQIGKFQLLFVVGIKLSSL